MSSPFKKSKNIKRTSDIDVLLTLIIDFLLDLGILYRKEKPMNGYSENIVSKKLLVLFSGRTGNFFNYLCLI